MLIIAENGLMRQLHQKRIAESLIMMSTNMWTNIVITMWCMQYIV